MQDATINYSKTDCRGYTAAGKQWGLEWIYLSI